MATNDRTYLRRKTQSVLTERLPQARKNIVSVISLKIHIHVSDLLNKTPTRSPFTQAHSFTVSMSTYS